MSDEITVNFAFVIRKGAELQLKIDENNFINPHVPTRLLVRAIVQEFGDMGLNPDDNYALFAPAPPEATLEELGLKDGDTLVVMPQHRGPLVRRG